MKTWFSTVETLCLSKSIYWILSTQNCTLQPEESTRNTIICNSLADEDKTDDKVCYDQTSIMEPGSGCLMWDVVTCQIFELLIIFLTNHDPSSTVHSPTLISDSTLSLTLHWLDVVRKISQLSYSSCKCKQYEKLVHSSLVHVCIYSRFQ